jgi:hypothetical protein
MGMKDCKKAARFLPGKCFSVLVILIMLTAGCTLFRSAPQFSYTLETDEIVPGALLASEITVQDQCVDVLVEFQGAGGDNDSAKLHRDNSQILIRFLNADHKSFKTLLLYRFSGMICGLVPDEYTLTIEDSNERVVLEKRFTIQAP